MSVRGVAHRQRHGIATHVLIFRKRPEATANKDVFHMSGQL